MRIFQILIKYSVTVFMMVMHLHTLGQSAKVKIVGEIELSDGLLWFVEEKENRSDTLGSAKIKNGNFIFEKHLDNDVKSLIMIEGYAGGIEMFLEPGVKYNVKLKKDSPSIFQGGRLNQSYQMYRKHMQNLTTLKKVMSDSIDNSRLAGHYRTAKKLRLVTDSLILNAQIPLDSLIKENSENVLGVYLMLSRLNEVDNLKILQQNYDILTSKAKETQPAKNLAYRIDLLSNLREGALISDFVLRDQHREVNSLYAIEGKLKIIDFWASWCGPCRLENPNMVSLYNDFKDKGLKIISVSLDEKEERWLTAIKQDNMTWHQLSSLKGWNCDVGKLFNVTAVPAIFILNDKNELLKANLRGEALRNFVSSYLQ